MNKQRCISKNSMPLIHIGMPKTATKTLQWRLFSQHREIFYLGRYDGPQFRKQYRKYDACRNTEVQTLMHEIAYSRVVHPDFDKCTALLKKILEPAQEKHLIPVWSWESYATDSLGKRRMRARNLKRVFGRAKILMVLRNPVSLLESAFLQQLKRDNVGPGARSFRGPFFCSIDDWVRREWRTNVKQHLEYAETIRVYVDHFGVENVHVRLFEELLADSRKFFEDICVLLDVNSEEGLRLVSGKQDNTRWTQHQLQTLQAVHQSPLKCLRFRFANRKTRREMLGLDSGGAPAIVGPKTRVRISGPWRKKIMQSTRQGNQWLVQLFNLPLQQYGYFEGE
mgnify:CR=1 FL=1